ncbi:hypothetical protein RclHR1_07900006 [Rhizophagus clarus]|uniref:Uncharacterized protein n=1 Tax=Rhizophagus clarus TaxID=94130 RepID=A0A2Z6S0U3_9GLOM|nr:hypothetical protein RclHR1_07900006 [Rhizophagus clarus]GES90008.1 hypothetical protein RCL_jg23789.t1 [Rhizophagus clarus]
MSRHKRSRCKRSKASKRRKNVLRSALRSINYRMNKMKLEDPQSIMTTSQESDEHLIAAMDNISVQDPPSI